MYNTEKNEVKLINATPDFVMKSGKEDGSSEILSVGEIESSPYVQMITASLGHISTPFIKYLLGIREKTVNLYLIHNKLGLKVHTQESPSKSAIASTRDQNCQKSCFKRR